MTSLASSLGTKLRRTRIAKGLSLDELVERAGKIVTKAALSKYERGQAIPRPSVLVEIARALGLAPAHLMAESESGATSIHWIAYRKHARLGNRERARIEALAEQRAGAFLQLVRLLHAEERPALPPPVSATTLGDAEDAVLRLRAHWGLGDRPIDDLVGSVEDGGVLVLESPIQDRFDALSGRTDGGIPIVVLDLARPRDRLRFNLAHELGHLLLDCSQIEGRHEERLANRFAAALLVPADAARNELGSRRSNLSTAELEHVARKYGCSMQAWTHRARDLGIITESVYREWQLWFRSRSLHVRESADYAGVERPQRFRVLCLQALAERVVDSAWIRAHCTEVGDLPSRLQQIRRLPPARREQLLAAAAKKATSDYERDPRVREWLEFEEPIRDDENDA